MLYNTELPIRMWTQLSFLSGSSFQGKVPYDIFKCSEMLSASAESTKKKTAEIEKRMRGKVFCEEAYGMKNCKMIALRSWMRKYGFTCIPYTCCPCSFSSQVSLSAFISKWVAERAVKRDSEGSQSPPGIWSSMRQWAQAWLSNQLGPYRRVAGSIPRCWHCGM